jgi:hypothetical protein
VLSAVDGVVLLPLYLFFLAKLQSWLVGVGEEGSVSVYVQIAQDAYCT